MRFEFDENKSQSNLQKHGIDFYQAQQLWDDSDSIKISGRTVGEERSIVIGKIKQKFWSAIVTYRANTIRIISVRRARKKEIADYEKQCD